MLNSDIFRIALLLSVSVHAAFLGPWARFGAAPIYEEDKEPVEVTYVMLQEPAPEPVIHDLPDNYALKDDELRPQKTAEKPEEDSYIREEVAEKIEGYAQYYRLIREKIKAGLNRNYPKGDRVGEVLVVFSLDHEGRLQYVNSMGEPDGKLRLLAIKSVKDSSPFPPFPAGLDREALTFNVLVSFR